MTTAHSDRTGHHLHHPVSRHRHIELLGQEDSILVRECVRFVHHAHRCSHVLVGVFLLVTAIFVQDDLKESAQVNQAQ